jgi:hypothetical protein
MSSIVYILTRTGILHKGIKSDYGIKTFESDNLDQAKKKKVFPLNELPTIKFKRYCKRCINVRWADV